MEDEKNISNEEKEISEDKEEVSENEAKNVSNDEDEVINNEESADPIEEIQALLAAKEKEVAEQFGRLQRNMAEFDNYRKRTEKEKRAMYEMGVKETLESFLPVLDNFERALQSCGEDLEQHSFVKGVDMIYKQFVEVLSQVGVEEIEAVGKKFDPNYHHAVTHIEDEEFGDNEVVEVFQKGYLYKELVLRHSMVKVAN